MFAPPLYTVRKFPLSLLADHHLHLNLEPAEEQKYYIQQQDNLLFRQIRLITGDERTFNCYFLFVDCRGWMSREPFLDQLILSGFTAGKQHFVVSERSGSMTRNAILSFVDETIADALNERITMGAQPGRTVLSKLYAYRGLMLSSCHSLPGFLPKVVVVPDCHRTISKQVVKYAADEMVTFRDREGCEQRQKQKKIKTAVKSIDINAFDGCGIHHPALSRLIGERLGSLSPPTSILWRAPYIKGVTHEMDYEKFYRERGVDHITDLWGVKHDFKEPMLILTESMYKGKAYFSRHGDARDWDDYWREFYQYNHCLGVAKWNFTAEEEPVYTRSSYQILQDLRLPFERFAQLAKDSVDWVEQILSGDPVHTFCFLGLTLDQRKSLNDYTRAILKNPAMLREPTVHKYLVGLLRKYRDEMKCGKLFLKSSFKFLAPDLVMLMEHIGGLPLRGCLPADRFYAANLPPGEYLVERNPHICRSEHVILRASEDPAAEKYFGHLANVCMVSSHSIVPQRLNGADFDGDLVLVADSPIMLEGVDRKAIAVLDTEDKITSEAAKDTAENKLTIIKRTMKNMIGENSNCATAYHNKTPKTAIQRQRYESYIDLISIITGKSIDYAKTGVLFLIPRHISKFGKPLPYFMKYAGPSYKNQKLSRSLSNMNRLCWQLEKWDKELRFCPPSAPFDHTLMLDESVSISPERFAAVEEIYLEFCKEVRSLGREQAMIQNYDRYQNELEGRISREDARSFSMNWKYYYDLYRTRCAAVCPNEQELANIAVTLCYDKYPKRNKRFLWAVAGNGVVENIKPVSLELPERDPNGPHTYLGRRYKLIKTCWEELNLDS
ncbi:RNA dependent RNA polymerase [Gehongia tenuis]|uniref:RDRP core domain-containing protein n=1 Tax=Gehongia tenuis TaxID=2763655 RepID=A0A926D5R1_9FIRM|nr:hypothetical protein [Gehongia tenuis]MBC8531937.1 hypothetical protein [Gehongia tenuis]